MLDIISDTNGHLQDGLKSPVPLISTSSCDVLDVNLPETFHVRARKWGTPGDGSVYDYARQAQIRAVKDLADCENRIFYPAASIHIDDGTGGGNPSGLESNWSSVLMPDLGAGCEGFTETDSGPDNEHGKKTLIAPALNIVVENVVNPDIDEEFDAPVSIVASVTHTGGTNTWPMVELDLSQAVPDSDVGLACTLNDYYIGDKRDEYLDDGRSENPDPYAYDDLIGMWMVDVFVEDSRITVPCFFGPKPVRLEGDGPVPNPVGEDTGLGLLLMWTAPEGFGDVAGYPFDQPEATVAWGNGEINEVQKAIDGVGKLSFEFQIMDSEATEGDVTVDDAHCPFNIYQGEPVSTVPLTADIQFVMGPGEEPVYSYEYSGDTYKVARAEDGDGRLSWWVEIPPDILSQFEGRNVNAFITPESNSAYTFPKMFAPGVGVVPFGVA